MSSDHLPRALQLANERAERWKVRYDALKAEIATCSRCGETPVLNRRPHDDIVVCERCMHEMSDEWSATAWDEGFAAGQDSEVYNDSPANPYKN